jgi:hypothetical protein
MIEIQKNNNEVIRIYTNTFKEKEYIDIRVYYKDKKTGNTLPSKKGITLTRDKGIFQQLMKGLCDYAEQEGLQ